jgi:hypothetical protein
MAFLTTFKSGIFRAKNTISRGVKPEPAQQMVSEALKLSTGTNGRKQARFFEPNKITLGRQIPPKPADVLGHPFSENPTPG